MRRLRLIPTLALAFPSLAQVPLFVDGPPFGGSRVFSEGLAPLANAARFDQARMGSHLTWIEGDQGAEASLEALDRLDRSTDLESDLRRLAQSPWALRTRAVGLAWSERGWHLSLAREAHTGALAQVDLNPTHLGSGLSLNTTRLDLRRTEVDRLALGAGAQEGRGCYGFLVRIERWRLGRTTAWLMPPTGAFPLPKDPLSARTTTTAATAMSLDLGCTVDLARRLRVGLAVDRLLSRRLGDVKERPQIRAGGQLDLGERIVLNVESDVNRAERMPFPIQQRVTSASLRMDVGPRTTLTLGAERHRLVGDPVVRGGLTLWFHWNDGSLGLGLQVGGERPLKGLAWSVQP